MKNSCRLFVIALLALAVSSVGCGDGDDDNNGANNGTSQAVAESKQAHEKYKDLGAALDDGYVSTHEFAVNPEGSGAMGVHFVNQSIMGIDPNRANVLVYDVDASGQYQLGAVEWIVPTSAVDEAPTLFGETFVGPIPGHGPDQPEHYELHAWYYIDNPNGMFAQWNTNVEKPSFAEDLTATREAVSSYTDVANAVADGYVAEGECVSNPDGDGAMGLHYVNETITGVDHENPNVLVYMPDSEGNMKLVAVEWFVPEDAVSEAPELFGQTFKGPIPGHEPGQPSHYELHAWTHSANPDGLFAQFNPSLSCPN